MEILPRDERLRLAASLNWDYDVEPSALLEVIDGQSVKAGPFDAQRLLVRSLERLSWHRVLRCVEGCKTDFFLTGGTALSRG